MYLSKQIAYLILATRRTRVMIVSRTCAHTPSGKPVEPENFGRRNRLTIVSMETVVAIVAYSETECI